MQINLKEKRVIRNYKIIAFALLNVRENNNKNNNNTLDIIIIISIYLFIFIYFDKTN